MRHVVCYHTAVHFSVGTEPIFETDERFLSVALDMSQVVGRDWWAPTRKKSWSLTGGHHPDPFDFNRPQLRKLASALGPLYLKIGGTLADEVYYAMDDEEKVPKGYRALFTKKMWQEMQDFAHSCGFTLIFSLNARNTLGKKAPQKMKNMEALLEFAVTEKADVPYWCLGNEINAFPIRQILKRVGIKSYLRAYQDSRVLLHRFFPSAKLVACSCAVWPVIGEPLALTRPFLKASKGNVDVLSWHYYPQQSHRSPIAVRKANIKKLLKPITLDSLSRRSKQRRRWVDALAPNAELWLGETASALCGGEMGLSDSFGSSLWWLDHLGQLARDGHRVVVRQTLVGADYGLIDEETLTPRPDYWASLLWKKMMGTQVFDTSHRNKRSSLRIYAHHSASSVDPDSLSLLIINVGKRAATCVFDPALSEKKLVYLVEAQSLASPQITINGVPITDSSQIKPIHSREDHLQLPPFSYAFVRCRRR